MANEDPQQPNEVMNGDEAAVFLKMPKSTLLKLCSEGEIPGVKVGRQWRFHRDALEKWAAEKASAGEEPAPEPPGFSENLEKAEAGIARTIKEPVEEIVGSVGDGDFEGTGDVVELGDGEETTSEPREIPADDEQTFTEGVGEPRELKEEEVAPAPKKRGRKPKTRSASALELMAEISERTPKRRGRPPKNKPPEPKPAPAVTKPSRDVEAVEVSRPLPKPEDRAAAPPARREGGGGGMGAIRKLTYWVVVLIVLVLAGIGVRSILVPVQPVTVPSLDGLTAEATPSLPEFQVVYKHNDPEESIPAAVELPTPPPAEPADEVLLADAGTTAPDQPSAVDTPEALPTPPEAMPSEVAPQPSTPISTPRTPDVALESINRILPGLFNLEGTIVRSDNNEIRVMFQEGVFSSGINVNRDGRDRLARISEFLAANAPDFWVIIEGQTDSVKVRPGSIFRDNYTLGLRRAVAATEVMREDGGFPPGNMLASSAGGAEAPFPEDEPGAEKRNRTVVLRLVPKAASIPSPAN
jgi:excisionase family DNA binding protein